MMRSLWAGVSGLQAHQIAMDTEGNNIANVNTSGFKYSRVNFSDMLSQTGKIATAPQGELGGKNPMQVGLGTQVSSVTKIFKQGSVQTTDKNTDLAIQGDGFFVVSPDGGSTYKYTRNGDFNFDALGNFTDGNGYIVQGWLKDESTGVIDATTPIANITIPPGLTTPANESSYITLKANLNSGDTIVNKQSIYALDTYEQWYDKNGDNVRSTTEVNRENDSSINQFNTAKELVDRGIDMGVLYNANGESFTLRDDQGIWVSYARAQTQAITVAGTETNLDITLNGTDITGTVGGADAQTVANNTAALINTHTSETGVGASVVNGNQIVLSNDNNTGSEAALKNIKLVNNNNAASYILFKDTEVLTAYQYTYSSTSVTPSTAYDDTTVRQFNTTEDLRRAMQKDTRDYVNYTGEDVNTTTNTWSNVITNETNYNPGAQVSVNTDGQFQITNTQNDTAFDGRFVSGSQTQTNLDSYLANSAVTLPANSKVETAAMQITLPAGSSSVDITYDDGTGTVTTATLSASTAGPTPAIPVGGFLVNDLTLPAGTTFSVGSGLDLGTTGIIYNNNDGTTASNHDMFVNVTELTNSGNDISANSKLTTSFSAMQGALVTGNSIRTTQNIYAANHASSIDVYDSLGSKHTVRIEFTKTGTSDNGGTEWSMMISVPEPGQINYTGSGLDTVLTGSISYNSDGSLATFSPTSITYTANNGSTPNQNILLDFGTLGAFDGMTSFDQESNTSGISQDGYPGGDLDGVRIDETGTLIGSFTNGRSFGLAQVSMAKFTNNGGLESDGGNAFIQTSNSGEPIIGQAALGGRGFIQASALEMSNVDLSRSLTQLIVIQRGFQANSKTITTSDQMLNTLLQLKQ